MEWNSRRVTIFFISLMIGHMLGKLSTHEQQQRPSKIVNLHIELQQYQRLAIECIASSQLRLFPFQLPPRSSEAMKNLFKSSLREKSTNEIFAYLLSEIRHCVVHSTKTGCPSDAFLLHNLFCILRFQCVKIYVAVWFNFMLP